METFVELTETVARIWANCERIPCAWADGMANKLIAKMTVAQFNICFALAKRIRPKNDFEIIESFGGGVWECFMVSALGFVDYSGKFSGYQPISYVAIFKFYFWGQFNLIVSTYLQGMRSSTQA